MGQKLLKFYEQIKREGGVTNQTRLVLKTGLTSKMAETEPDSPENIAKFKAAFKEITGKEAHIN